MVMDTDWHPTYDIIFPVAGNHHDLNDIEDRLDELFSTLSKARIAVDGLFINADAGFDSAGFRNKRFEHDVIANTALNQRNEDKNEDVLFDEFLYEQRYAIEKANA